VVNGRALLFRAALAGVGGELGKRIDLN
jgi:hypothetical protein